MKDEYIEISSITPDKEDKLKRGFSLNTPYDNEEAELVKTWINKADIQLAQREIEPLGTAIFDNKVQDPSHYAGVPREYEHHRVMDAIGSNYHFSNAMKYLWRAGKKSSKGMSIEDKEIQDVRKAIRYLEMWIEIRQETVTKESMHDVIE
jgi:hypothetical protein